MVGKGICPFYGLQSVKIGSNSHCLLDNCKMSIGVDTSQKEQEEEFLTKQPLQIYMANGVR